MANISPFEVFARTFPDVTQAYRSLKNTYGTAGPLDEKTKQLIQIAIMVSIGSEGGTRDHVGFALDAGATPDEVRQTILMVLGPAGMSRTSAGIAWASEVIDSRGATRA